MEFLTALATGIVSKVGETLVQQISAPLGYLIYYNTNISNMKKEKGELEAKKRTLQGRIKAEEMNGHEITETVKHWLHEVGQIEKVLQKFNEDEERRNKKCLGGWCPNLITRYSLSRKAKKTLEEVVELKLKEEKLGAISLVGPPLKLAAASTDGPISFESRKSIVREVMEKLKDDSIKRMSICGMGGVGKTTLARQVMEGVVKDNMFDAVVMIVVSQNPDYWRIQGDIAYVLGVDLNKESLLARANQLLHGINKTSKVLIVLDDVWIDLDFQSIGLPSNYKEQHRGCCRVIFTSRDEGVCQRMGSQETFKVDTLSDEESWDLFCEISSGESHDVVNDVDIQPIAKEIVSKCKGLPIAIVTVGRALVGTNKEKLEWEDALNRLTKSSSASFSAVQSCIELSCSLLDREEAKYFLFLCCFFPDDADIPIEDLMRQAWGLGFLKGQDALRKARVHVQALMNYLKKRYLLLESDNKECVKMHDVVRDAIMEIASIEEHGFTIHCDADHEKKLRRENAWNFRSAVSIAADNGEEWPDVVEHQKLELLQMASKEGSPILVNFFQAMSKLKVLFLQNMYIPKGSSLYHALNDLRTLRLEGNCQLGDISIIGKELMNLEILSFAYSDIKELPMEIGQLKSLKLLDLTECNDLEKFSSNILKNLYRLEELYFRVRNFPWMQNSAVLVELKKIAHQLKIVELRVRKVETLKDLIFEKLESFWVYLVPYGIDERCGYLELNILQLTAIDYNTIKSTELIKRLIKKCEILIIERVKNLKNVICDLDDGGFPLLKYLNINMCSNLEYLVDGGEIHKLMIHFPSLVSLNLTNLASLIGFNKATDLNEFDHSTSQASNYATHIVESTNVEDGQQLSSGSQSNSSRGKLFSCKNWKQQFQKLETIQLIDCPSLQMVFDLQGYSEPDGQPYVVLFPQLKAIEIISLNNLSYLWSNVPQCVQGFQNLSSLIISGCNSLKQVFTPAIARAVTNLKKIEIEQCEVMENLMAVSRDGEGENFKEKGTGEIEAVVFHKLDSLTLSYLPMLRSICADSYELEWPLLRNLSIHYCPKLNISFQPPQPHAKQENPVGFTSLNPHGNAGGFNNFQENSSRSSNWHLGCTPFHKLFHHTSKNIEETSSAQNYGSSISEMKTKIELIGHMPIPPQLKTLRVVNCESASYIVAKEEERMDIRNSFNQLESLDLDGLSNLVGFCLYKACSIKDKQEAEDVCEGDESNIRRDPLIHGFLFRRLTSFTIKGCNKISMLFTPSSSESLESLKKLTISYCKTIEEIVSHEEREAASINEIEFPKLQNVYLENLPNLRAFCQGSYTFDFPALKQVTIENCPNMEVFSQGLSQTHKSEDVIIVVINDDYTIKIAEMGGLNAVIQGFKTFVALQTSEVRRWSELPKKGLFGYFLRKPEMEIKQFDKVSSIVSYNEVHLLQHVKGLNITECDSLEVVFESEGGVDAHKKDATMPHNYMLELEGMVLHRLPKLRQIWKHNIIDFVSFQKLTVLVISDCDSLKSLLSHSMARSLVQLQELIVTNCKMMGEIVTKEDNHTNGGSKVKILFPKLKTLSLDHLPKVECVCWGDYDYDIPLCDVEEQKEKNKFVISFPELEELHLRILPSLRCFCSGAYDYDLIPSSCNEEMIEQECQKNTTFPNAAVTVITPNLLTASTDMGYIQIQALGDLNLAIHYALNSDKYKVELQKLESLGSIEQNQCLLGYITTVTELVIESCDKLLNCIPSNMMHRFQHFQKLKVQRCGSLQEIFESKGANDCEGDTNRMQFELLYMELHLLPKLMHIWKTSHARVLSFQHLAFITISGCHDLKYVFPLSIARSLPDLVCLDVRDCNKMEEIIITVEEQTLNTCQQQQQPNEAKIIFPNLAGLILNRLPNLNCFCSNSCSVDLPFCANLRIEDCPNMQTFCHGTIYTRCLNSLSVEGKGFDIDEDVNEIIQMQHIKNKTESLCVEAKGFDTDEDVNEIIQMQDIKGFDTDEDVNEITEVRIHPPCIKHNSREFVFLTFFLLGGKEMHGEVSIHTYLVFFLKPINMFMRLTKNKFQIEPKSTSTTTDSASE